MSDPLVLFFHPFLRNPSYRSFLMNVFQDKYLRDAKDLLVKREYEIFDRYELDEVGSSNSLLCYLRSAGLGNGQQYASAPSRLGEYGPLDSSQDRIQLQIEQLSSSLQALTRGFHSLQNLHLFGISGSSVDSDTSEVGLVYEQVDIEPENQDAHHRTTAFHASHTEQPIAHAPVPAGRRSRAESAGDASRPVAFDLNHTLLSNQARVMIADHNLDIHEATRNYNKECHREWERQAATEEAARFIARSRRVEKHCKDDFKKWGDWPLGHGGGKRYWQRNQSECQKCRKSFDGPFQRHHCRVCCFVSCDRCAPKRETSYDMLKLSPGRRCWDCEKYVKNLNDWLHGSEARAESLKKRVRTLRAGQYGEHKVTFERVVQSTELSKDALREFRLSDEPPARTEVRVIPAAAGSLSPSIPVPIANAH